MTDEDGATGKRGETKSDEHPSWARTMVFLIRSIGEIATDLGLPVASFAMGVYLLVIIAPSTGSDRGAEIFGWGGLGLILLGVLSHLWMHARENPRRLGDAPPVPPAIEDQLKRSMQLVEHLAALQKGGGVSTGEKTSID